MKKWGRTLKRFMLYSFMLGLPFAGCKSISSSLSKDKRSKSAKNNQELHVKVSPTDQSIDYPVLEDIDYEFHKERSPLVPLNDIQPWLDSLSQNYDILILGEFHRAPYRKNIPRVLQNFYDAGYTTLDLELDPEKVNGHINYFRYIAYGSSNLTAYNKIQNDIKQEQSNFRQSVTDIVVDHNRYDRLVSVALKDYIQTMIHGEPTADDTMRHNILKRGIDDHILPFENVSLMGLIDLYNNSEALDLSEHDVEQTILGLSISSAFNGGLMNYMRFLKEAHEIGFELSFFDKTKVHSNTAKELEYRLNTFNTYAAKAFKKKLELNPNEKRLVLIGRGHTGDERLYSVYNNDFDYQFMTHSLESALHKEGIEAVSIDVSIHHGEWEFNKNFEGIYKIRPAISDYELILSDNSEKPLTAVYTMSIN